MTSRDDFDPHCHTVEQQCEDVNEHVVTEMIRSALLSPSPSLLGALIDPDTGSALFPILAAKNERLLAAKKALK